MIRVSDLSVSLASRPVLSGIDLEVESGSWVCVIGPNGSGKTTLLRAVAGLVRFSGEVVVCGENPAKLTRRHLARKLAYVPQVRTFPDGMRVQDYVLLGRTAYIPYWGTEGRGDLATVARVLERLSLDGFAGRTLSSLSGGELQRAALARALAQQPEVLLLDEPTSGLDVGHQQQVMELVDSLRAEQQLTVLSAIHDLTLAGQFSDRVVLLDEGRICASGPAAEVVTEESVLKHYGARVRIVADRSGRPALIPIRDSGISAADSREAPVSS